MKLESKFPERRISAATLTVPKKAVAPAHTIPEQRPPKAKTAAMFERLQKLMDDCGPKPNKHDLVIALITACITEGVNTRREIIAVLVHLGLNNKHVAMMLKEGAGSDPEAYRWRRNEDGVYRLLS